MLGVSLILTGCATGGGGGGGNTDNEAPDQDTGPQGDNDQAAEDADVQDEGEEQDASQSAALWTTSQFNGITSFADPGTLDGSNVLASTSLELGFASGIFGPRDVVLSTGGTLFIADQGGISIYEVAATASGSRQADRTVSGPNTQLTGPVGIAFDPEQDVLFVSNNGSNKTDLIAVFDNVTDPTFDGDVSAARIIRVDATEFDPTQMAFTDGDLYVISRNEILVFAEASSLDDSDAAPDRIISSGLLTAAHPTVALDSANRLIVTNQDETVFIWNDASQLNGSPPPDLILTFNDVQAIEAAVIDSDDRLYAADTLNHLILIVDNVSTLTTGSIDPAYHLAVYHGGLSRSWAPWGLDGAWS